MALMVHWILQCRHMMADHSICNSSVLRNNVNQNSNATNSTEICFEPKQHSFARLEGRRACSGIVTCCLGVFEIRGWSRHNSPGLCSFPSMPIIGMEHTQCLASWNEKAFVDLQVYDDCVTLLSIGGFSRCCFNVEIVRLFSAGMTLRLLLRTQPAASMLSQQVELRGESPFSSRMASQVSQCLKSSESLRTPAPQSQHLCWKWHRAACNGSNIVTMECFFIIMLGMQRK